MKTFLFLLSSFLTAIVGLIIGGLVGMLAFCLVMLVVGSDFGLDNVRPGVALGAAIGFFFGLWRPHRWSWLDFLVHKTGVIGRERHEAWTSNQSLERIGQ